MRLIVQRVRSAAVSWEVDRAVERREIGAGLAILAGAGSEDTPESAGRLATKVAALRIFADSQGRFNRSLPEVGGSALVVSQFTLYGDLSRGRRPSFIAAGDPAAAARRIDDFIAKLRDLGVPTESGSFGAHMLFEVANDGPVTFALSTDAWETRV